MASAPTSELGSVAPFTAIPGWKGLASYTDDTEDVPELRWQPDGYGAVATYERMRGDAQVHALWSAMTLPIRRYRWMIDPNGARDVIVEKLSEDLGLPIQRRGRLPAPHPRPLQLAAASLSRAAWPGVRPHVLRAGR